MSKTEKHAQVWAIEGQFRHLVYSPRGGIEGLIIDTDGALTQFVVAAHDLSAVEQLRLLSPGRTITVEGTEEAPSPKGDAPHFVYAFVRLALVDGEEPELPQAPAEVSGRVVRFNYARHGAPNGVVLDTGHFVHTRPDGFADLALEIGDAVRAEGPSQPLATGDGYAVEARIVNGRPVESREH